MPEETFDSLYIVLDDGDAEVIDRHHRDMGAVDSRDVVWRAVPAHTLAAVDVIWHWVSHHWSFRAW